uniref:TetR family transcriptional regulator n=1 Tax=Thermosporothrix sp. COM3 TaxID=2490863 RepID=A0A455SJ16_9CHLR|nr:TetR family transcriptional regulator [Thermosporothrix sp. COM3]
MVSQKSHHDRRVQRTRQTLQRAYLEIVREKLTSKTIRDAERCFLATTIQEIAERANVNRGTFYLHFPDKYMLVEAVTREQFRQVLTDTFPAIPQWDYQSLHLVALTVLQTFEQKYQHEYQTSTVLLPLLERTAHEELTSLLVAWLKAAHSERIYAPLETRARIISWAIFGPAVQWSQEEAKISAEEMAHLITQTILKGTELPST